jgi:hypothetical protein
MALALTQEKGLIFRITHRDNVPWILDNGMHASGGEVRDPNWKNIGNLDLIDKRSRRSVPVSPGGCLSDYVPFYFTPYSIMMFNVITGYNVKMVPRDEIVIFVSSLPHVVKKGLEVVFTNQHAYPPMADYYCDLALLSEIDWSILDRHDFKNDPDDPGKKERYQAEALIWKHVPLDALQGVCCYTKAVEEWIHAEIERRGLAFNAAVQPDWYFK